MLNHSFWFSSAYVLLLCTTLSYQPVQARQPKIVEVPAGPAFVKLPGSSEKNALSGQALQVNTLLRTSKPGRLQVMLEYTDANSGWVVMPSCVSDDSVLNC